MDKIIATIWITTTIFTLIPNLLLAYKYYSKKVADIHEAGFIHFICLYLFVITTILMTGKIVNGLL